MSTDHVIATFTTDSKHLADTVCAEVRETGLCKCVQIEGPISSRYSWHGVVHSDQEWRVEIETTADKADALVQHIHATHGIEVPQIMVTDSEPLINEAAG